MCFSAAHWAGIRRIVYGASIADARRRGFNELTISSRVMKQKGRSPVNITAGVLRAGNRALFELWAKGKKARAY